MGLDMYLNKNIYVGANYEHNKIAGSIKLTKEGKPIPVNLKRVIYIEEQVGYWRKANQIHKWFVDNVQEGVDNCGEYDVSKEKLMELLESCEKVKAASILKDGTVKNGEQLIGGVFVPNVEEGKEIVNAEIAEQILPTQSGFFFGGTDYDEFYMHDIDDTIEIIKAVLSEIPEDAKYMPFEIQYSSSW